MFTTLPAFLGLLSLVLVFGGHNTLQSSDKAGFALLSTTLLAFAFFQRLREKKQVRGFLRSYLFAPSVKLAQAAAVTSSKATFLSLTALPPISKATRGVAHHALMGSQKLIDGAAFCLRPLSDFSKTLSHQTCERVGRFVTPPKTPSPPSPSPPSTPPSPPRTRKGPQNRPVFTEVVDKVDPWAGCNRYGEHFPHLFRPKGQNVREKLLRRHLLFSSAFHTKANDHITSHPSTPVKHPMVPPVRPDAIAIEINRSPIAVIERPGTPSDDIQEVKTVDIALDTPSPAKEEVHEVIGPGPEVPAPPSPRISPAHEEPITIIEDDDKDLSSLFEDPGDLSEISQGCAQEDSPPEQVVEGPKPDSPALSPPPMVAAVPTHEDPSARIAVLGATEGGMSRFLESVVVYEETPEEEMEDIPHPGHISVPLLNPCPEVDMETVSYPSAPPNGFYRTLVSPAVSPDIVTATILGFGDIAMVDDYDAEMNDPVSASEEAYTVADIDMSEGFQGEAGISEPSSSNVQPVSVSEQEPSDRPESCAVGSPAGPSKPAASFPVDLKVPPAEVAAPEAPLNAPSGLPAGDAVSVPAAIEDSKVLDNAGADQSNLKVNPEVFPVDATLPSPTAVEDTKVSGPETNDQASPKENSTGLSTATTSSSTTQGAISQESDKVMSEPASSNQSPVGSIPQAPTNEEKETYRRQVSEELKALQKSIEHRNLKGYRRETLEILAPEIEKLLNSGLFPLKHNYLESSPAGLTSLPAEFKLLRENSIRNLCATIDASINRREKSKRDIQKQYYSSFGTRDENAMKIAFDEIMEKSRPSDHEQAFMNLVRRLDDAMSIENLRSSVDLDLQYLRNHLYPVRDLDWQLRMLKAGTRFIVEEMDKIKATSSSTLVSHNIPNVLKLCETRGFNHIYMVLIGHPKNLTAHTTNPPVTRKILHVDTSVYDALKRCLPRYQAFLHSSKEGFDKKNDAINKEASRYVTVWCNRMQAIHFQYPEFFGGDIDSKRGRGPGNDGPASGGDDRNTKRTRD